MNAKKLSKTTFKSNFDKILPYREVVQDRETMQYLVIIEEGENSFGAYVPDLPGYVAVAETEDEVNKLIQEAIEFHLEDLAQSGIETPKPLSKSEYVEVLAA